MYFLSAPEKKVKTIYLITGVILFLSLTIPARFAFAQEVEQERKAFTGTVGLTHKGVSHIPSFTLGKPAVIFNMSVGKRKLVFEPRLQFSTRGKPWAFLFRLRYRMLQTERFRLGVVLSPVLSFITSSVTEDDVQRDAIEARRFIGGQILSDYSLTKNLNAGMHYLYSRGIEESTFRNMHFISFTTRLSNIEAFDGWAVTLNSQVYYLRIDEKSGAYFSPSAVLAKRGFPFSLSAMINRAFRTDVPGDTFLWSASVIYSY